MVSKKLKFGVLGLIVLVCTLQFVIAVETGSDTGNFDIGNNDGTITIVGPGQPAPCGNGIMQPPTEQCDGSDFGGVTCQTLPGSTYTGGNLACSSSCTWNTNGCTQPSSGGDTGGSSGGGGGGGGGGGSVCTENWECSNWTECKDGKQTRTCNDKNNCRTIALKPIIESECSGENTDLGDETNGISSENDSGFFSSITGAIIGFNQRAPILFKFVIVLVLAIVGLGVYFLFFKKKEDAFSP